jgi:hypothetical protein
MKIAIALSFFFLLGVLFAQLSPGNLPTRSDDDPLPNQHVELGDVRWERDFEKGISVAASSDKPLFVLFQEIPGCQTCQNFGNLPLSHPLVVEAIESLFVPVAIFNNKPGTDASLLRKFGEPSWNNPVVRYLNSDETDVIPRKDGVWSTDDTVHRMIEALTAAGKSIPQYLQLTSPPAKAKTETAEFAMSCYWEGEASLGQIDGVLSTRAGWRDNLEVVQLTYVPEFVDYESLVTAAQSFNCASQVFAHTDDQLNIANKLVGNRAVKASSPYRDAKPSDQKYYLAQSIYRHLPLTEIQATKINALVKQNKTADSLLSPRQLALLQAITTVSKNDNQALREFVFPEDQNQLASYQQRLVAKLQAANALR